MMLELSGNIARLDWTKSFSINSHLEQFVLFINSSAVYIGRETTFTYSLPTATTIGSIYALTLNPNSQLTSTG